MQSTVFNHKLQDHSDPYMSTNFNTNSNNLRSNSQSYLKQQKSNISQNKNDQPSKAQIKNQVTLSRIGFLK